MFIYGVIPALILAFWYATIKALTQRSPETVADFIFLIVTLFVLPIGYGYFLYRLKKPDIDRRANMNALLTDLYNFAQSDDYIWVGLDFDRFNSTYNGLWFKSKHKEYCDCFNFNDHGYERVDEQKMLEILRKLEKRTGGYLTISTEEIGGYDPSVTVTHGTMPGGGDGYYVNVGGYDTAKINKSAYVILGDEAERWRQAARDRARTKKNGNGLRKL